MQLLILGASVRAATASAVRAGYSVMAADWFGDRDLRELVAEFHPVDDYPHSFLAIRKRFPHCPVVYTGALENHPDLLEELESLGPVYGTPAACLRTLRDPFQLARTFASAGIAFPETTPTPPHQAGSKVELEPDLGASLGAESETIAAGSVWLVKSMRSAGGMQVRTWNAGDAFPFDRHRFFQRYVAGTPVSAAFVACPDRPVVFLGATNMLVGKYWGGPGEFSYCGSVTAVLDNARVDEWQMIASVLGAQFPLQGVFGIDAVSTLNGLVPLEVNPRYTASMEVLEPSLPQPIMAYHVAACQGQPLPAPPANSIRQRAKRILYAPHAYDAPPKLPEYLGIQLADVPTTGQQIQAGQPLCTMMAEDLASLEDACARFLSQARAAQED